jgi:site-specific DNA recombinase
VYTAIYLRVSSDRTGEELGVTRQREDARKLCQLRGWNVVEEFTDNDISAAGRRQRPGFEAMLKAVQEGRVRCVVAWDMSRITRNARDRIRLLEAGKKHGVTVAFVRGNDLDLGTPAGRLTADILGSVAQHEIEQKSDRQRRAVVQAVEQGRWIGGRRPFGYEPDGVTVRLDEADAVIAGFDAVLAGVPLGRIAADWNARGLLTPQAKRDGTPSTWAAQSIRPVFLNPRYAGLRSHVTEAMRETMNPRLARIKSVSGAAAWPALVSEETWRAVVDILTDPTRANLPRSGQGLLTGVARCGVCGATVHRGATPPRRGRPGYPNYRCRASTGHIGRAVQPVDVYVAEVVIDRLSRPDAADLLVDDTRPGATDLRREAGALRVRLDALAGLLADGVLSEAGVRRESVKLRAKLAEVEARQAKAGRVSALKQLVGAADVRQAWEALDTDRQRSVIQALMTVTLLSPGRGTRTFRPESIVIDWTD